MTAHILVPLEAHDRIEDMIPRIEEVAQTGMTVSRGAYLETRTDARDSTWVQLFSELLRRFAHCILLIKGNDFSSLRSIDCPRVFVGETI